MVSSVSVSVPIWLTLTRMLLATPISMPRRRRTTAPCVNGGLRGGRGLSSPAKALGKAWGAGGHHLEFLEVDLRLGMPASIEDVHHRNRHHQLAAGGEVAIERLARRQRGGARGRQGGAQHGIGTQPRF